MARVSKEADRAWRQQYRNKNRERLREIGRKSYRRNRDVISFRLTVKLQEAKQAVFALLGDRCARCGFSDKRALQLDHRFGDGWKDRDNCNRMLVVYKKALIEPWRFQVLCANCNWIKRHENGEQGRRPRKQFTIAEMTT